MWTPREKGKKGWTISLDRDGLDSETVPMDKITIQLTHPDRPFVLLGFVFSAPREGNIQGPDWIPGLVQMANRMVPNGYSFYYLRWDWKQIMHEVKTPQDLQNFLDQADPSLWISWPGPSWARAWISTQILSCRFYKGLRK